VEELSRELEQLRTQQKVGYSRASTSNAMNNRYVFFLPHGEGATFQLNVMACPAGWAAVGFSCSSQLDQFTGPSSHMTARSQARSLKCACVCAGGGAAGAGGASELVDG